jgi:thiamine-phosphate pyrophosphorylase
VAAAMRDGVTGLYAITPEINDTGQLLVAARAAVEGGARVVQYRNKRTSSAKRLEHAIGLSAVCAKFGALFIINDDIELALSVEADGVHLGKTDGSLAKARARLGPQRLLGASCYNDLALAQAACDAGADHLAFGSMFASSTKPDAIRAPLTLFAEARARGIHVPLVAIGGITLDHAPAVISAGASAIAVISDLFDAPDIRIRAEQFSHLFKAAS